MTRIRRWLDARGVPVVCLLLALGWSFGGCAQGRTRQSDTDGGEPDSTTGQDAGPDPAECGNGTLDPGEVCDDGNTADGDDCRWDCLQDLTLCGNGLVDPGEGCDDGGTTSGDGCSAACQEEGCSPSTCAGCCDAGNVCQAGIQDTLCGTSGAACQDCTSTGLYCQSSSCQPLGSCTPAQQQPCGDCGTMTCDSQGQWGPCENEGVCAQGQTDTGSTCGNCGTQERTCTSSCQWGSWSCVDEGICSVGQTQTGGTCGGTGTEERTCNSSCQWGPWDCIGGCPVSGHMGTGENGDPCSEAPETWRCTYSNYWGTYISQVCRNGSWLTCELNPSGCVNCCGSWSLASCGDCV